MFAIAWVRRLSAGCKRLRPTFSTVSSGSRLNWLDEPATSQTPGQRWHGRAGEARPTDAGLLDFPDSHGPVAAAGSQTRAVLIEGDGVNGELMVKRCQQVAGFGVPQFHGAVMAAGR